MKPLVLLFCVALAADADSIAFVDDSGLFSVTNSNPNRLQVVEQDYGGIQNFVITILPPTGATESFGSYDYYETYIGKNTDLLASYSYVSSWGVIGDPQPSRGELSTAPAGASCEDLGPHYCSLFPTEGVPVRLAYTDWNDGTDDTVSFVMMPEPATFWLCFAGFSIAWYCRAGLRRRL